jgi:hypothetical protein
VAHSAHLVTIPAALREFAQCRDVLRRALRIEDSAQPHRAFAAATAAGSSSGGVVELLALCARAAAACGDADDAVDMAKKASAATAALSGRSVFWFHVTCGEAHMIVAESSHSSAAAAAAAAAAAFSLGLKSIPSASMVARMKLQVAIGESSRDHLFFRLHDTSAMFLCFAHVDGCGTTAIDRLK